ncbi:MAG TPA: type II secretion system protein GspC [Polyangiaceae bacterium]|jgi:general secretion pathway protein C|nr:type II secretion system protein GspC [Polyangiaceae bacterium]
MALDALAKRFFPALVMLLVAMAAYFQASGLMQLIASAYLDTAPAPAATPRAATRSAALAALNDDNVGPKTAEPILSRNPFDSVTGPLNKVAETEDATVAQTPQLDLSNPLSAPDCGGIQAHAITESQDPLWSVAVLQATGETMGRLRRVGDAVADKQVAYIGFNTAKNSPSVWLTSGAVLCQVLLFAPATPEQPAATASAEAKPPKDSSGVPDDIAKRIQKVSDTEFHIDRSVVDNILENQAQLMRTARIVPEQKDGKVVGIRLFGIRPETLLGKLGLQNGDRLEAINGFEMASPEKALEAYARLRTADSLAVKVTRRGAPVTIDFKIQ